MSKKNNKKTKARQHAFDLERERAAVQKHKAAVSECRYLTLSMQVMPMLSSLHTLPSEAINHVRVHNTS